MLKKSLLILAALLCAGPAFGQAATCDQASHRDTITALPMTELVPAGPGLERVYICGYVIMNSGQAATIQLFAGNGVNCAANQTEVTPPLIVPQNTNFVNRSPFVGERTPQSAALCWQVTGNGSVNAIIYWTQF